MTINVNTIFELFAQKHNCKIANNKYFRAYANLAIKVHNANRVYNSSLYERHHVIPKSFGGDIELPYTFKEHYIAHLLLPKFLFGINKHKMTFALHTFFHFDRNRRLGLRQSSTIYEAHKKRFIDACMFNSAGVNNPRFDHKIYKFKNVNTSEIIESTRTDFVKGTHSNLTSHDMNALIRVYKKPCHWTTKGWSIYVDSLDLFTDEIPKVKRKPAKKNLCPHCKAYVDRPNYKRWHGDNCKFNIVV